MERLAIINQYIKTQIKGGYQLPKIKNKKHFYIVPLSGGIDSFATAYIMLCLYPDTPFVFVHCDTGIEAEGTEEALHQFEINTGKKIVRIKGKYDMLEMIERGGNFLPSQRQRSCTQTLKTLPIKRFFQALKEKHGDDAIFIQFVGLRADEPLRQGIDWKEDYIASAYPLQSLGLTKSHVNTIAEIAQGIPSYYINKSRSGCKICIFSRRSEIIDAWNNSPAELTRAAEMEGIPDDILARYNDLPIPVHKQISVSRNWIGYYRPSLLNNPKTAYEAKRGNNKLNNNIVDLFGANSAKRLFVAVEYHYYKNSYGLCEQPHVFFENIITYSGTLGGVKVALKHFWLHRLHTKEMYDADEIALSEERQIQMIEIEIDGFDFEVPPKPDGVYTWQNDKTPLYAIRKTVSLIEHVLLCEGLKQDLQSPVKQIRDIAVNAKEKLAEIQQYGRILSSIQYDKPSFTDLTEDIDISDAPVACLACSR